MAFYTCWYTQSVCRKQQASTSTTTSSSPSSCNVTTEPIRTDVTPVHVTVSSRQDRIVYNIEFKPLPANDDDDVRFPDVRPSARRDDGFATRRPRKRTHTRTPSSGSATLFVSDELSGESMWDGWIVKYINDDCKRDDAVVEDESLEEWIFGSM